jgi:2-dehydro-3-deoxyphosphogluconate aldolase/(4S)-4-hydroxy-2-oxoglutarate aldolase
MSVISLSATAIVGQLEKIRIIPVTSFDEASQAKAAGAALLRGGVGCIEVTFRTAAAPAAIAAAAHVDGLLVGAGTILSADQVHAAVAAGAHFGVAPGLNPSVVEAAQEAGFPFFPGIASPSEAERARELGVPAVKVFPVSQLGGPSFLKAIASVYTDLRFIPTGGVAAAEAPDYLAIPSVLAVGGSWLAPKELVNARRFDEIERIARETQETIS